MGDCWGAELGTDWTEPYSQPSPTLSPASPLHVMPVLPHLRILAMFGFLQRPASATVFSLHLHGKVAK